MKKPFIFIALLVIFIVTISAHGSRVIAPEKGYTIPALSVESDDSVVSLSDYKGKYLLLTFWASTDAQSRVRCNEYEGHLSQDAKVCRLSINLDRNNQLFREIVRNDNLNPEFQLSLSSDEVSKVISDFELQSSFKSFLIDPAGQVVEINPSIETLKSI